MFDDKKIKLVMYVVIILLIGMNVLFIVKYNSARKASSEAVSALENQKVNEKVLEFTELFIDKVIRAQGEIDFETRLKLEEAVRKIGDEAILAQWQKFVGSNTSGDAQAEVKELLWILIKKIGK